MKTKELIRLLQEADPEGEFECCVDNIDIHFVEPNPVYWDGHMQKLIRDESKKPYFDIVGAEYATGTKLNIRTFSISDGIENDYEFPVDYSNLSSNKAEYYKTSHNKEREQMIGVLDRVHRHAFYEYINRKKVHNPFVTREEANKLYDELGLHFEDKLDDIQREGIWSVSIAEREELTWDRLLNLQWSAEGLKITKNNH